MGYYRISKSDRSVTLSDTEFAPVDSAVILNDYAMPIEKVYDIGTMAVFAGLMAQNLNC